MSLILYERQWRCHSNNRPHPYIDWEVRIYYSITKCSRKSEQARCSCKTETLAVKGCLPCNRTKYQVLSIKYHGITQRGCSATVQRRAGGQHCERHLLRGVSCRALTVCKAYIDSVEPSGFIVLYTLGQGQET